MPYLLAVCVCVDHLLKHDTRTSQRPLNKLCDALLLLFERRKYERRKKSRASKDVHVEDRRQLYGQSRSMLFFMCIAKGIDVLASSSSAHSGKKEKKISSSSQRFATAAQSLFDL
jgi:hypothetical protein